MNFAEYIGLNNPEGVNRVLIANGYLPCEYIEDCPGAIEFLCNEIGPSVTEQFLLEHPDYQIILDIDKKYNSTGNTDNEPVIVETETPIIPKVSSEISKPMINESLTEIIVIIMAFWLLNKIISS